MSKEFVFPVRVYYEDTDCEGVVYYANYLKFMERGRTEWLRALGYDVADLARRGYIFAVSNVNLSYLAPARLGDEVEIVTKLEASKGARLIVHQSVRKVVEPVIVYCQGLITLVSVGEDFRPRKILPELMEKIRDDS